MDRETQRQTEKQRAKVLQDLWKMDDHGVKPVRPSSKSVDHSTSSPLDHSTTKPSTTKPVNQLKSKPSSASKPADNSTTRPSTSKRVRGHPTTQHSTSRPTADLSSLKIDTRKNKSDEDSSWQDILEKDQVNWNLLGLELNGNKCSCLKFEFQFQRKHRREVTPKQNPSPPDDSSKASSVRNDEVDLDLVPDRDWSTRSSGEDGKRKKSPENAGANAGASISSESGDKMEGIDSTKRRHQFKKKRQKTLVRQASYAKEDNDYTKNLVNY